MLPNPQKTADLVTFTENIFNGKLHFLCSAGFFWPVFSRIRTESKIKPGQRKPVFWHIFLGERPLEDFNCEPPAWICDPKQISDMVFGLDISYPFDNS